MRNHQRAPAALGNGVEGPLIELELGLSMVSA